MINSFREWSMVNGEYHFEDLVIKPLKILNVLIIDSLRLSSLVSFKYSSSFATSRAASISIIEPMTPQRYSDVLKALLFLFEISFQIFRQRADILSIYSIQKQMFLKNHRHQVSDDLIEETWQTV